MPDDRLAAEPDRHLQPEERDPEASPADVVEQEVPADPAEAVPEIRLADEASEWDAVEQARIVGPEDEYDR